MTALHSLNTKLLMEIDSAFVSIASVTDIQHSFSSSVVETTSLVDNERTFIKGIVDSGELSLTLQFNCSDTGHLALRTAMQETAGDTGINFKVVFPDSGAREMAFTGIVQQFDVGASVDEILSAEVTIKISGAITETA